jgi:riboflavin-specific deaminase-like protein
LKSIGPAAYLLAEPPVAFAAVPDVIYNQLLPAPDRVDAETLIAGLDLEPEAPADRPYTLVNFVATVDGSASFQGRSGGIGDDGDRRMFHALREPVDAVLAGTGTLRAERYGRILGRPERRRRRLEAGRSAEPLACVITRSGELPLDIPLFTEPEARLVVFSPTPMDLAEVAAQVQVELYDPSTERSLTEIMRSLRQNHQVRTLLCEGGPSLFGSLLKEQLVDELFLTVAPKLSGGSTDPTITVGDPLPELAQMRIAWLLEHNDSLYLRYRLKRPTPSPRAD